MIRVLSTAVLGLALLPGMLALTGAANADRPRSQNRNTGAEPMSTAEIYGKHCASCHGKDGRAKTFKSKFIHARDFTAAKWQESISDEHLFNSIINGKGSKMPAWGKKLSETEINALVTYVRRFRK